MTADAWVTCCAGPDAGLRASSTTAVVVARQVNRPGIALRGYVLFRKLRLSRCIISVSPLVETPLENAPAH